MCRLLLKASPLLCCFFIAAAAEGVTLDWDAVTWTPGTYSNSFDVDPAHSGNDVTVGVSFASNRFVADPVTGLASPSINNSLSGGLSPAQNSLKFVVDYTTALETITVTIDFTAFYPQGVQGVSFTLFDIDMDFGGPNNKWQDQINTISATDGSTSYAATITNLGASVTLSGTGLAQTLTANNVVPDSGAGSSEGNATISFGSNWIKSLSFTFAAGPASNNNPETQYFGLHDLAFTPVPEINPAWGTACSCAVAALVVQWLNARRRRQAHATVRHDGERRGVRR